MSRVYVVRNVAGTKFAASPNSTVSDIKIAANFISQSDAQATADQYNKTYKLDKLGTFRWYVAPVEHTSRHWVITNQYNHYRGKDQNEYNFFTREQDKAFKFDYASHADNVLTQLNQHYPGYSVREIPPTTVEMPFWFVRDNNGNWSGGIGDETTTKEFPRANRFYDLSSANVEADVLSTKFPGNGWRSTPSFIYSGELKDLKNISAKEPELAIRKAPRVGKTYWVLKTKNGPYLPYVNADREACERKDAIRFPSAAMAWGAQRFNGLHRHVVFKVSPKKPKPIELPEDVNNELFVSIYKGSKDWNLQARNSLEGMRRSSGDSSTCIVRYVAAEVIPVKPNT